MNEITELRHKLGAALEPILRDGEQASVNTGQSEYAAGLKKLGFEVSVSVGEASEESSAERLDELLAGAVKDALEDAGALVIRSSGYQHLPPSLLGATWTVQILK